MNTFKLTQTGPETQDILDQVNGNTEDIEQLKDLYQAFVGSGVTIVESSDWPISNPQEKVIYRVTGESSYSDYMWNGTHFIEMATYDNAIDDEPTAGSNNLVKSGGVYEYVDEKTTDVVEFESLEGVDLNVSDGDGGSLVQFSDGHIKTKNFDSAEVVSEIKEINEKLEEVEGEGKSESASLSLGQTMKLMDYHFEQGKNYQFDIDFISITPSTEDDIIFVLRKDSNTSVAIYTNIHEDCVLTYTPTESHDELWISCYLGTCDVTVTVSHIADTRKLKVSIIGDSLSAYESQIPATYRKNYPSRDVYGAVDMWYSYYFNGVKELDVNASSSGSGVSSVVNPEVTWLHPTLYERSSNLGNPNEIVIELGVNDRADVGVVNYDLPISSYVENQFAPALIKGIKNLIANYPCATITYIIPHGVSGQYITVIKEVTGHYGIKCIDLSAKSYATTDTVHPNKQGMKEFGGLAAEYSNFSNEQIEIVASSDDLEVADIDGGVLAKFANGHIQTKNFNSATLLAQMEGKVDKVEGKGLSENDLTDALLAQIEATIANEGKPAVITIAASNASSIAKNNANYVCSGTNDQNIINGAIAALPSSGGEIHLSAGIFYISNPIVIDRNIKITGEGQTIAGRPVYTPKEGWSYTGNIYGLNVQNLYGVTDGNTVIRIEADVNGIEIGSTVNQKLKLVMRDFLVQGYGKDRHTKCGIYGRSSTDISTFDNISVTDCHIGCYLHGNSSNAYNDAAKIVNSSFQWCGCGLIVYGAFVNILNCCIADNNGISSFTDGEGNTTDLNIGGLYMQGSWMSCCNSIFMRNTSYKISQSVAGDSIKLKSCDKAKLCNNYIWRSGGAAIKLKESSLCTIDGNSIGRFGEAEIDIVGQKSAIVIEDWSPLTTIINNSIGGDSASTESLRDYIVLLQGYHYDKNYVVVKNNSFMYMGTSKTSAGDFVKGYTGSSYIDPHGLVKDNIYYGTDSSDVKYFGEVLN